MSDQDNKPVSGKSALEEYYNDLLDGSGLFDAPKESPLWKDKNVAEETPTVQEPAATQESLAAKHVSEEDTPEPASSNDSSSATQGHDKNTQFSTEYASWSELSRKVSEAKQSKPQSLPLPERPEPVIPKPAPLTVSIPKPAPETVVEDVRETELNTELKTETKVDVDLDAQAALKQAAEAALAAKIREHDAQATKSEVSESPAKAAEAPKQSWTERDVDCLLFKVNGLTLAVPLEMLGSVHKLKEETTPLFGSAPWFLGIFMVGEEKLNLLDTTRWVMPERYSPSAVEKYRFAIRLGKSNWAVACDEIGQAIKVTPKQVKWRTERGKRTWLAGTVIEHMCGLLDAENLLAEMESETKKRKLR